MRLKAAFEEMELVLNELNEQFETIKKNEERVPQIEIDIIMASMRRLYDNMSHLNIQKQFSENKIPADNISKKENSSVNKIKEIKSEKEISDNSEVNSDIVIPIENDISDGESVLEIPTDDFLAEFEILEESEKSEKNEIKTKISNHELKPVEVEKPSLLLQFEDEIFSVNESVAKKSEDKSVVNKLNNTRIENLKSAIGINDKFYFINELFGGNSQAYEDVIYTLNNFKRFEEAMQYVSTLKYRYDWKTETEAYQKLAHFLERKFVIIHA